MVKVTGSAVGEGWAGKLSPGVAVFVCITDCSILDVVTGTVGAVGPTTLFASVSAMGGSHTPMGSISQPVPQSRAISSDMVCGIRSCG